MAQRFEFLLPAVSIACRNEAIGSETGKQNGGQVPTMVLSETFAPTAFRSTEGA